MNKKNCLFWAVYVFILIGFITIFDNTLLVKITSVGESIIATFFLLLIGFAFKKWFDDWYEKL